MDWVDQIEKISNTNKTIYRIANDLQKNWFESIFNNEIWTPISTKSFKSLKKNSSHPFSHHTIRISVYR